ncbi:MAG: BolA family protein [Candidatus Eremiobacterota bacterium]
MNVAQRLEEKLRGALSVEFFELENVSHHHAGHSSSPGTGESHFNLVLVAAEFEGQNQVARHRMVYGILADELAGPVHALSVKALAPGEH